MSGIWDRIIPGGENSDRVSAHLLKAAMHLAVYGVVTGAQMKTAINGKLTSPLSAAALADLDAIQTSITAQNVTGKLTYLERFDAMNIMAESGALTSEAIYRAQLGIA